MKHLIGHNVEDFKVQAYHQRDFKEITLQDTKGHWSIFFLSSRLHFCLPNRTR